MRRARGPAIAVLSLLCVQAALAAGDQPKKTTKPQNLSDHERALHVLQRLTFGPRPGDMETVLSMGVNEWIEQQLNPSKIPNTTLDGKLAPYRTLRMQPRDLAQAFPT